VEFVDIAGLVKGASQGQGLGNKFLSHIRETDAIAMVVRCFEDGNITHVDGSIDPPADVETILTELCLADLETVEKGLARVDKLRKNDKVAAVAYEVYGRIKQVLMAGNPAITVEADEEQEKSIKELNLLTRKRFLYIGNVAEGDVANPLANPAFKKLADYCASKNEALLPISAKIESEVAELSDEEAVQFLADVGIQERGLHAIIRKGYEILDLISFFTAGEMESKAWTIRKGTLAPQAAGVIHTDFERGFIKAEVVSYEDYDRYGNLAKVREAGRYRTEGKEYVMKDGDVVHFKFNVT
jgi:GTP-binding protein YchF